MQDLQKAVMDVPKALQVAIGEWPLWFGFSGLEYAGDWIQRTILTTVPISDYRIRNFVGAVVRGGLFSANLNYYYAAQSSG
jgi:hypothetical protein